MLLRHLRKPARPPLHLHQTTRTSISQPKYLISNSETLLYPVAETLNDTRELYPQGLWCLGRYRILALALEQIHAVETKGFDLHYRVRFFRLGFWYLGDEKCIGVALPALDVYDSLDVSPLVMAGTLRREAKTQRVQVFLPTARMLSAIVLLFRDWLFRQNAKL